MVVLDNMSDFIGNVLVDENNTNIFARGKFHKGFFGRFPVLLGITDNQKVGPVLPPPGIL